MAKARREVEELDFAEPSEGSESVEPEGSEKGESEAPEVDEEVDETIEVEDEEGSCEEVVVREEPADSSQGAVEGPSSAKGASMGSFSVAGQTGVSPVVAKGDAGTTMSSSSAMHNLLVGSLATTNRRNRELARARLDALKERSENDFLAEKMSTWKSRLYKKSWKDLTGKRKSFGRVVARNRRQRPLSTD